MPNNKIILDGENNLTFHLRRWMLQVEFNFLNDFFVRFLLSSLLLVAARSLMPRRGRNVKCVLWIIIFCWNKRGEDFNDEWIHLIALALDEREGLASRQRCEVATDGLHRSKSGAGVLRREKGVGSSFKIKFSTEKLDWKEHDAAKEHNVSVKEGKPNRHSKMPKPTEEIKSGWWEIV